MDSECCACIDGEHIRCVGDMSNQLWKGPQEILYYPAVNCENLITVVPQKDKDEQAGFVEYDMDEETGYRSPPLSSSSKPNRVLLE